jgi:hypothetical protein
MISKVERLVSDNCDMAQSNGDSADIVHKRDKITKQTGREVLEKDLVLGCWLASSDARAQEQESCPMSPLSSLIDVFSIRKHRNDRCTFQVPREKYFPRRE